MSELALTINQPHAEELQTVLFPTSGHESGALILCGRADVGECPWLGKARRRYLSRLVIPISADDIVSSSPRHFEWRKATFLKAYRMARQENFAICFVHSHRRLNAFFSAVDDQNDLALYELSSHRQSPRPDILSLVMDEGGFAVGRLLQTTHSWQHIAQILFLGQKQWRLIGGELSSESQIFSRQVLAYGPDFLGALGTLRITVVGAGATGSAVLQLLARLGARYLAVIDPDITEFSNITRIHGSMIADAERRIAKVELARRELERIGFDVELRTFQKFVTEPEVRNVLKSSDLIFGSTDDHEGRLFLNRFALFYNTPLIDMGIGIDADRGREGFIRRADSRVTVVSPGNACLICRGIAVPVTAAEEHLRRTDPKNYGRRVSEGYITTEFVPSPSVITLTTAVACMATDELTARLTGYRAPANHVVRKFVQRREHSPGPKIGACGVCAINSWGRGDVTPFLDRVG